MLPYVELHASEKDIIYVLSNIAHLQMDKVFYVVKEWLQLYD